MFQSRFEAENYLILNYLAKISKLLNPCCCCCCCYISICVWQCLCLLLYEYYFKVMPLPFRRSVQWCSNERSQQMPVSNSKFYSNWMHLSFFPLFCLCFYYKLSLVHCGLIFSFNYEKQFNSFEKSNKNL